MNMAHLQLFVEVAAAGSFASVARQRHVDPSSVSRSIASLEDELATRLFQRTTRRVALTEAGERLLARIEPVLAELELATSEVRETVEEPAGTLRLTSSVTFGQHCIVPLLAELRTLYPRLRFHCLFSDANLDLVGERIDLAIRLAPHIEGDVIATKLIDTRYRVVSSPSYLRDNPLSAPAELSERNCILFDLPAYRSRWRFRDGAGHVETVAVSGALVMTPAGALRSAALAGLGPALLPDWLVGGDLADGRLVDLLPEHDVTATSFGTGIFAVYPSRAFLPRKVRVVIDFLRDALRRTALRSRPINVT
ncbi:HTH-type transcriptional regulator DmlR [Nitratireductor thuwali]|uniref:HTH-type transcriptional regulator DmlR n=2 Tax=Nitratireductor thuwali TaxID=2267699 RepID=A0ABY5MP65_9HYPH|nr:HTH-type transcriptional regulator DmlR [Nitratireductor thuwali]